MTRNEVRSWLDARVRKEDGCLIWVGATNSGGHPVASVDGVRARSVRRWLHEQLIGPVDCMRIVMKCRVTLCLDHTHFSLLTPGEFNHLLAAEGRYSSMKRIAACRRNGRRGSAHTAADAERARQLRAEGSTLREISAATGMSISVVHLVCAGKSWKATAPAASVFTWRGDAA
jgi:hypothetical protein